MAELVAVGDLVAAVLVMHGPGRDAIAVAAKVSS
jgi:hypothetical protein